ncbi:unnamed protein product [Protopolystoma xenopodis]|uniref:Uncharacterized protein n=1 Tax=Protopolystoma xenopodis TaxID=117903 RepID=A0A448XB88_9PLAT|nr:unnamed protein product [Protopolystoma xenopodis]
MTHYRDPVATRLFAHVVDVMLVRHADLFDKDWWNIKMLAKVAGSTSQKWPNTSTQKEIIELDVSNLVHPPSWIHDELDYDIEIMRRPQPRFHPDGGTDDFFLFEDSRSSTGGTGLTSGLMGTRDTTGSAGGTTGTTSGTGGGVSQTATSGAQLVSLPCLPQIMNLFFCYYEFPTRFTPRSSSATSYVVSLCPPFRVRVSSYLDKRSNGAGVQSLR